MDASNQDTIQTSDDVMYWTSDQTAYSAFSVGNFFDNSNFYSLSFTTDVPLSASDEASDMNSALNRCNCYQCTIFYDSTSLQNHNNLNMGTHKPVQPRTFTWEGIKVVAPGGDLRRLFRSRPSEIWELFRAKNSQIEANVYRKIRSCLTEIYVGYLQEAKNMYLLSPREADERKKRWKDSQDWKDLENMIHNGPYGYSQFANLATILNSLSSTGIGSTQEASGAKKRKIEHIQHEETQPYSSTNNSLSNLSLEESSKIWLDYHLRSVLEAHPPSIPKDPAAGHAVERARPYLLSLKTRLSCLLIGTADENLQNELQKAVRDLETAWYCLSIVRKDEDSSGNTSEDW